MVQIHLINQVVEWERRLEIEEQKRKNARAVPERIQIESVQPVQDRPLSLLERIFKRSKARQDDSSTYPRYAAECCQDTQAG